MKKRNQIIIAVVVCLVLTFLYFTINQDGRGSTSSQDADLSNLNLPMIKTAGGEQVVKTNESLVYKNSKYGFSFNYPDGFSARDFSDDLALIDYVLVEDGKGNGIQIAISDFDNIKILTEGIVKESIPDMKMTSVEALEVGNDYKGIAFISDNPAYGGASREVWFVYKSKLYQISTYEKLDPLLKGIFRTWKFEANL